MATKAASSSQAVNSVESFAGSTMRILADVFGAVGEGLRARNEYFARVGQGADPVQAAEIALRHAEHN
jgi:hypothetical protein